MMSHRGCSAARTCCTSPVSLCFCLLPVKPPREKHTNDWCLLCRKLQPSESQKKLLAEQPESGLGRTSSSIPAPRPSIDAEGGPPDAILCAAGTVRGEDYNFHFTGKIKDGKLYVRLNLEYEGDDEAQFAKGVKKTIDFTYDPDGDTPEAIAKEIGDEFSLSSTDRDICAAALKEWLAKESPDSGR